MLGLSSIDRAHIHPLMRSGSLTQILLLYIQQVILLWAQDRSGPCYPDPSDECSCWEFEVFHCIEPYQRACSSEPSFTMNGHAAFLSLSNFEELINNLLWWHGAINKEEVRVRNSIIYESTLVVFRLI